jgi:hypothetical protein
VRLLEDKLTICAQQISHHVAPWLLRNPYIIHFGAHFGSVELSSFWSPFVSIDYDMIHLQMGTSFGWLALAWDHPRINPCGMQTLAYISTAPLIWSMNCTTLKVTTQLNKQRSQ